MSDNETDYGDQLAKDEIIETCQKEILILFDEAIGVNDTIQYSTHETLFEVIMNKLEEIL